MKSLVLPLTQLTLLEVVLTRTVQSLETGARPHPRPGAGQQLGRLPVCQRLDGVLGAALRVASIAAQHQIPSQHGGDSIKTRHGTILKY